MKISLAECNQIDGALHSHFVENLSRRFNKTTGSKRPQFDALPPSAQTVIMSVAYQYGLELNSATPQFWAAVTEQDWGKTIEILENFGDSHPTRRKKEAAYLKKGLN